MARRPANAFVHIKGVFKNWARQCVFQGGYCISVQVFCHAMSALIACPEDIHPSLWRASQLAHGRGRVVDTGYPALSRELPGGGWPLAALVDLLVQQPGIGELRLLRPALSAGDGGAI